jgi:hypothetical protein
MFLDNLHPIQFIPDILNAIYFLIVIIFLSIKYKLKKKYIIILSISLCTPFLFFFMFHWSFLPDQSKYSKIVYDLRNFSYDNSIFSLLSSRVSFASLLLALFPIPFVTSIISVGLINKGLLCAIIFYFLNKKNHHFIINLLVFLPSMIIISSIALREMLITALGILFFYFFLEKKNYFASIFWSVLLLLTKPHLGILCMGAAIIYFILFVKLNLNKINNISFSIFIVVLILLFIVLFLSQDILIHFREGFFSEEFSYDLIKRDEIITIPTILISAIIFLFSPLSTSEPNLLNSLIFIENLFLIYVKIALLKLIYRENQSKAVFWILVWIIIFTMSGFIVFNAGTIWRYKFVVQMFLVYAMYFSLNNKKRQVNLL